MPWQGSPVSPGRGGATIRRGPTMYIVLVNWSSLSTLGFYSSGFCPQCRADRCCPENFCLEIFKARGPAALHD